MPRCPRYVPHDWRPLCTAVPGDILDVFSLALHRLDRYDRCTLCGRISYIGNTRRRMMVSRPELVEGLLERAREHAEWQAKRAAARPQ